MSVKNIPPRYAVRLDEVVSRIFCKMVMVAVAGPVGNAERCPQDEWVGSRRHAQGLLLVLAQVVHVEVAVRFQPVLVHLGRERADQAQAAFGVGEDPDDVGAPLDLLVQPLQEVGRLQVLVVLARQPVKAQRLRDVLLDPAAELGIGRLPFGEPRREVAPGLGEIAPIVEPAQLTQARRSAPTPRRRWEPGARRRPCAAHSPGHF